MSTLLPRDDDNAPIPVMRLRPGGAHAIAVGAASARNGTAFDPTTRVVSLYATTAVFVRTGDATVTAAATDHFIPALTPVDIAVGGDKRDRHTHIAAIQVDAAGTLHVSERF